MLREVRWLAQKPAPLFLDTLSLIRDWACVTCGKASARPATSAIQGNRTSKHGKLLKDLLDSIRTEATTLTLATNIVFYGSVSLKNVKR